jgi:hypothetical protein
MFPTITTPPELTATWSPLGFDELPDEPPLELLEEIEAAAETIRMLSQAGLRVRFRPGGQGAAQAELVDDVDDLVRDLTPGEVLRLTADSRP